MIITGLTMFQGLPGATGAAAIDEFLAKGRIVEARVTPSSCENADFQEGHKRTGAAVYMRKADGHRAFFWVTSQGSAMRIIRRRFKGKIEVMPWHHVRNQTPFVTEAA